LNHPNEMRHYQLSRRMSRFIGFSMMVAGTMAAAFLLVLGWCALPPDNSPSAGSVDNLDYMLGQHELLPSWSVAAVGTLCCLIGITAAWVAAIIGDQGYGRCYKCLREMPRHRMKELNTRYLHKLLCPGCYRQITRP